jgi:hypothetical protein
MPSPNTPKQRPDDGSAAVDRWLEALDHPQKPTIAALRTLVCSVDPSIEEGIKWNSPSFRTRESFATVNLRTKAPPGRSTSPVALILHLGAKKRARAKPEISDPNGLLKWLGDDRAMLSFADLSDLEARRGAVESLIEQWIAYVE